MKKGKVHAPFAPPLWIKKKVQSTLNELLRDIVYNVYNCGCFLINEFDKERKGREKKVHKSNQSRYVCECEKKGRFICKVKICSDCGLVLISKRLKDGMCRDCTIDNNTRNDIHELLFYQNGKLYDEIPQNPNYTEPNCKYRGQCLSEITPIPEKNIRVFLWCYNCPKYKDERPV
jgi:hypothetical protein